MRSSKGEGISGVVRVEPDVADLSSRFKRGEIVVIDQPDLDRVTAERFIERHVVAVINASASISGRYPNPGPQLLINAGITVVDFVGPAIFDLVVDGDRLRIDAGRIYKNEELISSGAVLDRSYIKTLISDAQSGVGTQLENLVANAAEQLRREQSLFLDGHGIPRIDRAHTERPAIVVSRAYDVEADLKALKRYVKNNDPVLIGAGRGADELLNAGHRLDIVVGAPREISQRAMNEATHVVFVTEDGSREGQDKLDKAGKQGVRIRPAASTNDLSLLVAAANDASVVITAGAPTSLVEFLDRSQADMASSLLTRMRLTGSLVDAKAVKSLTAQKRSIAAPAALLGAGVVSVGVAVSTTAAGEVWMNDVASQASSLFTWIRGLFVS